MVIFVAAIALVTAWNRTTEPVCLADEPDGLLLLQSGLDLGKPSRSRVLSFVQTEAHPQESDESEDTASFEPGNQQVVEPLLGNAAAGGVADPVDKSRSVVTIVMPPKASKEGIALATTNQNNIQSEEGEQKPGGQGETDGGAKQDKVQSEGEQKPDGQGETDGGAKKDGSKGSPKPRGPGGTERGAEQNKVQSQGETEPGGHGDTDGEAPNQQDTSEDHTALKIGDGKPDGDSEDHDDTSSSSGAVYKVTGGDLAHEIIEIPSDKCQKPCKNGICHDGECFCRYPYVGMQCDILAISEIGKVLAATILTGVALFTALCVVVVWRANHKQSSAAPVQESHMADEEWLPPPPPEIPAPSPLPQLGVSRPAAPAIRVIRV